MGRTMLAAGRTVLAPGVGVGTADLDSFIRLEDLAAAICAQWGGPWHVVPMTQRDGSAVDYVPWLATIGDGEVTLRLLCRAHETRVEATFAPLFDDTGRQVSYDAPRITFARSRPADRVAADLRRRLLEPGRSWWEHHQKRLQTANTEHRRRHQSAASLVALGCRPFGSRHDVPHLDLGTERLRSGVHAVRMEVRTADLVRMELDLASEVAVEVTAFLVAAMPGDPETDASAHLPQTAGDIADLQPAG